MVDAQKASHLHNIVYLRYMEGFMWLLFKIQILHADGRVGENNATGGPNSSAETELI